MAPKTLLSLVLAAGSIHLSQAVNIVGYNAANCQGPYGSCGNVGPNVCCIAVHGTAGAVSGGIQNLPSNSGAYGYQGGEGCTSYCCNIEATGRGPGNLCAPPLPGGEEYAGFGWFYTSAKRDAAKDKCTSQQEWDTITFANGTAFKLDGMKPDEKVALWNLAIKEAASTPVRESTIDWKQMESV